MTRPNGERFSLSCTPPATLADLNERYPGARIEPEPEPQGGEPDPQDAAIIGAWLDAIGETDPATRAEILSRAAVNPDARATYFRAAVAAGAATWEPPEPIAPGAPNGLHVSSQ
ncbi:hypothetical protein [Thiocapsa sp.]|uniref:hypothetical protein n=1 Tax=Thiocapsa sp. TaxID=2024551 RepID=UPI002C6FECC6|nr:hypothetical protein [Thiocapsa sp.]HSO84283.1 hypothetical protein [Thiocapsa sp.]